MLLEGLGVPRDDAEAVTWVRRAAAAGDVEGENTLGMMLTVGRGLPQDEAAGVQWFRRAAARGSAKARSNLAFALAEGRGVERNDREAARWYYLAAVGGEAAAQNNLGALYHAGRGVIQDHAEGVRWQGQAAVGGNAAAQLNLGTRYEMGAGVETDLVRAYAWYALAAREREDAAARRQALAVRLEPARLAEAEQLAATWQRDPASAAPRAVENEPPVTWEPRVDTGPLPAGDPVPREVLFVRSADPRPRLSPDARRVAFLAPWRGVLNLWVRTLDTGEDRRLTAETDRDLRRFAWQCDGEHVLYLRDPGGAERWRLYQTAASTGQTRELTPPGWWVLGRGALACTRPHEALFMLRTPEGWGDAHRVDLRTGAWALETRNPGDVRTWVPDRALGLRGAVALSRRGEPVIRVREEPGSPWRDLYRGGADDVMDAVGFTSDGAGLFVRSNAGALTTRVLRIALDTGHARVVAEDPDVDVADVEQRPVTGEVDAVEFIRARSAWVGLDAAVRADLAGLRAVADGDVAVVSRSEDDRTWIARYVFDDRPPEYYRYDRATRRAAPLFEQRPRPGPRWPPSLRMAPMRPVSFRARDGLVLQGYLTLPAGVAPQGLPLVLRVHGGPWSRSGWGFDPEVQWLASRGYAVLDVNFRGSSGYGRAHLDAGDRQWGGAMHGDLLDAKRWAVTQGYARIDQVCLLGASYGGYAAMAALALSPGEFACAISYAGIADLVLHLESRPANWLFRGRWDRRVGTVADDSARLESISPLHLVHEIRGGLLVAHGAVDPVVDRVQGDLMVSALRTLGGPVAYLLLPAQGHDLDRPLNRLRYHALAEQVLARYLGGRLEPTHAHEDPGPFLR
jgi:dipeptidyl aminopeptidase/acylaminoacyl peptidase